jgi:hypothetical protein
MDRRRFIAAGASTALAASLPSGQSLFAADSTPDSTMSPHSRAAGKSAAIERHRFGVNYTPSSNWWFCWNQWNPSPIQHDLDAIAALGADHMRIMLIWPYFQPNPTWVSPAHLERLSQLLELMAERHLDALVTVFTGQLSGWHFLPPFNRPDPALYNNTMLWAAEELFVHELSRTMNAHRNVIGFDFGNEMNTCWQAPIPIGDAWMTKMFALMDAAAPTGIHVNGVDHSPWFRPDTFSPGALASNLLPVVHAYPYWTGALKFGGPMDPPSTHLLTAFAALVRSYAGNPRKPVWVGEFNTCIESMPEKQQAAWLETAVTSAIDAGVNWFTYWDSHDVNRKFAFNSLEYSLGLLTNDGKVKDQGRVFRQLVSAYQGKPVRYPNASLPALPQHNYDATWQWILNFLEWKTTGPLR